MPNLDLCVENSGIKKIPNRSGMSKDMQRPIISHKTISYCNLI